MLLFHKGSLVQGFPCSLYCILPYNVLEIKYTIGLREAHIILKSISGFQSAQNTTALELISDVITICVCESDGEDRVCVFVWDHFSKTSLCCLTTGDKSKSWRLRAHYVFSNSRHYRLQGHSAQETLALPTTHSILTHTKRCRSAWNQCAGK